MSEEVNKSKDELIIRYSVSTDASELAYNLREADRMEILNIGLTSPLAALQGGFNDSVECFTVEHQGKPIAMFGVVEDTRELFSGFVWLLGADEFLQFKRDIIKQSPKWLEYFLHLYPKLSNMVWAGNEKHVRWLKWLGFEFSEGFTFGPHDETFYYFWKVKENV